MIELRYNTQQIIPIGVLQTKKIKLNDPNSPVVGALLSWYYWRYIRKANGTVLDIVSRTWADIPSCAGCYTLTLLATDTNMLGPLVVYISDAISLESPIYIVARVITQNVFDAKYGSALQQTYVEPFAQKG